MSDQERNGQRNGLGQSDNEERMPIIDLPGENRPRFALAPLLPHPNHQLFQEVFSARRVVDPLRGIRLLTLFYVPYAKLSSLLARAQERQIMWHYIIPADGQPGHGSVIWQLLNESQCALPLPPGAKHSAIENGLSDAAQWSLSLAVVGNKNLDMGVQPSSSHPDANNLSCGYSTITSWQCSMVAELTRSLWYNYPNFRTIVDGDWMCSHMKPFEHRELVRTFWRWEELKKRIIDPAPAAFGTVEGKDLNYRVQAHYREIFHTAEVELNK